jgi:hypothetical protein
MSRRLKNLIFAVGVSMAMWVVVLQAGFSGYNLAVAPDNESVTGSVR